MMKAHVQMREGFTLICPVCGKEFNGNFCPQCGEPAGKSVVQTEENNNPAVDSQATQPTEVPPQPEQPPVDQEVQQWQQGSAGLPPAAPQNWEAPVYGQEQERPTAIPGEIDSSGKKRADTAVRIMLAAAIVIVIGLVVALIWVLSNQSSGGNDQPAGAPGVTSVPALTSSAEVLEESSALPEQPGEAQENSSSQAQSGVTGSAGLPGSSLTPDELKALYSDPQSMKGTEVVLTGVVFTQPEQDETTTYFQMFADIENYEYNTIVAIDDLNLEVAEDDYVRVTGVVGDTFEGENIMGDALTAPIIVATQVEVVSYIDAASPTLLTVEPQQTVSQLGYDVTVTKVEFAQNETRVYVTVANNGSANFSLYDFYSLLIQNGKQYEQEYHYSAEYPEVQTDLRPGVTTEGIITFPAVAQESFELVFEGSSDNYEEEFEEYRFEITVP